MQFLTKITFNPTSRMEDYRDKFEHHWIIETSDEGIEEANILIIFFKKMKATILNAMKRKLKSYFTSFCCCERVRTISLGS